MYSEHDVVRIRDWQTLASLALGLWLFFSPWGLRYAAQSHVAAEVAWFIGAVLISMSVLASLAYGFREGIGECVSGLCLIVSPWELDYAAALVPTANAVAVGLLFILLSLTADWREEADMSERHVRVRQAARGRGVGIHGDHGGSHA